MIGRLSKTRVAKRLGVQHNLNKRRKYHEIHDVNDPRRLPRQQEAGPELPPDPKMVEKMGKYNEELGKVFKITDLNGLHPLTTGARVSFTKGKTTVTDGPFIETKEVLGGYWMLEAPSKEEVVKWAQKCPAEEGDIIEVREIFDFETK